MILRSDNNDELKVTVTLAEACGQRKYACFVTACGNPTCTCSVAYVNLYAIDDGELVDPSQPDHTVCIDVIKKKWVTDENVAPSRQERIFGKAFFKTLDADDLQLLWKLQGMFKVVESEEAPVEAFNIAFDFNAVEIDGLMYAYNDVLPYGSRLKTCIDTCNYLLFDHYCLRRGCDCALVSLAVLNESPEFSVPLRRADEVCSVQLDYRSRKWQIPKHSCHDSLIRKIRKECLGICH